jgi:hypothetical protein
MLVLLLATLACRNKDAVYDSAGLTTETADSAPQEAPDSDGDGWVDDEDCDPQDPLVHPGANEVCNGLDDDCNGVVDDAVGDLWYTDADGDTFGDPETEAQACEGEGGQVADATDCDDGDPSVYPEAEELCDLQDNDCDGDIDEEATLPFYADADDDGYGDASDEVQACEAPSGYLADGTDCDDGDAEVNPGAEELCDDVDNDCDGSIDEDDAADAATWYADDDDDGYGDPDSSTASCSQPSGFLSDSSDCDDRDDDVHPGAVELCNDEDDDCDGSIDEDDAADASTWYTDSDGDGYGDPDSAAVACDAPTGTVADDSDCDDTDSAVSPAGTEVCDEVDNDCDGDTDEDDATDASTWYADDDSDGYGDAGTSKESCDQPRDYVSDDTDCDDNDDDVFPGADELCNDEDDDCDGTIDESDALDASTWYTDSDGDGYGDSSSSTVSCEQPTGSVEDDTDCDDADADVSPAAEEVCDGVDNDCDGTTDPDAVDTDGDGTANCIDADVWDFDFATDSISDWSEEDLGGSNAPNWNVSGSYVCESSNAAYSVLTGPDLGELDTWTFSADVYIGGAATDYLGLVFDYVDEDNYQVARVNDPTGYYSRFSPTGQVELVQCVAGTCTTLASDDTHDFTLSYNTVVAMSVSVDGADVTINWDGTDVLTYTASSTPVGAGTIGFFSYDNDSGACYGNPEVTNP